MIWQKQTMAFLEQWGKPHNYPVLDVWLSNQDDIDKKQKYDWWMKYWICSVLIPPCSCGQCMALVKEDCHVWDN